MDLLREILNSSSQVIFFSLDREYRYLVFNKNHEETMRAIWGVDISEGVSMLEYILSEEDRQKAKANFDRALGGEQFTLIEEYGDEKLQRSYWEDYYSPIREESGEVVGVTVYVTDITERRRAEVEIAERESLLDSITRNIQEGIYRSSAHEGINYVNDTLLKLFGYESLDDLGKLGGIKMFVNSEDRERLLVQIRKNGFITNERIKYRRKDGSEFWGLLSATRQINQHGQEFFDGAVRDISDQVLSERRLYENEQLLNSINQNISEGIYRSDQNGMIYVNQAFARLFGYDTPEEILANNALRLYKHPEEREMLVKVLERDGFFRGREVTFLRKDKSEFVGLISSTRYQDGNDIYWDGAIIDITDKKKNSLEIEKREELLRSINQNINEAIYRSEIGRGLIYVNDAFIRMFGFNTQEEVFRINPSDLYMDPVDRDRLGDLIQNKGYCSNLEIRFKRKDGSSFLGAVSSRVIRSDDGFEYFDGAIRDITSQKETENWMREQADVTNILMRMSLKYLNLRLTEIDEEIQNSLEQIGRFCGGDRVYVFDIDHEKNTCSNTYEWVDTGISPEIENCQDIPLDMMGEALTYHEGLPLIITRADEVISQEYRHFLQSQNIKSLLSVPSMDQGDFVGFVGIDYVKDYHEVTEAEKLILTLFAEILVLIRYRKSRQAERQQLLDTATSQNSRLKDFSYITSHNIRSSVSNLMALLKIQNEDPANNELNGMMQITARRLSDTLDNINELLNFENELEDMTKVSCNVRETIDRAVEMLRELIASRNVQISIASPGDLEVLAFPAYLDSIMHNLISNAAKYGISKDSNRIEIRANRESDGVIIMVQDFGNGLDLEKHGEKLFKLGSRFHSDQGDGQGLGLFMTKHQTEVMGGHIEVESKLNSRTVFKVWLP